MHMIKFKTAFPEEFSNEIWLKLKRDFVYIYIAWTKFWNIYSGAMLGANHFFPHPQKC